MWPKPGWEKAEGLSACELHNPHRSTPAQPTLASPWPQPNPHLPLQLHRLVATFLSARFPLLLALNKVIHWLISFRDEGSGWG